MGANTRLLLALVLAGTACSGVVRGQVAEVGLLVQGDAPFFPFPGSYPVELSGTVTINVSVPGVYSFQGTCTLTSPYNAPLSSIDQVTVTAGGQPFVSETAGTINNYPLAPPGWDPLFTLGAIGCTKVVTGGVYLPAGPVEVVIHATGTIGVVTFFPQGIRASLLGTFTAATPEITITGPSQFCSLSPSAQMTHTATPPGGQLSNWRVSPTSIATIDQSGVLTATQTA